MLPGQRALIEAPIPFTTQKPSFAPPRKVLHWVCEGLPRRVFVFLGLARSESGPNDRPLRESLLFADSRQRGSKGASPSRAAARQRSHNPPPSCARYIKEDGVTPSIALDNVAAPGDGRVSGTSMVAPVAVMHAVEINYRSANSREGGLFPVFIAAIATSVRFFAPSFLMILRTWTFTVLKHIFNS
jgi:hypothetical protein